MTTQQHPIGSRFGAASSAAEVLEGIDLSGQVAIVTGGYSGLGLETTRALADAGATVLVPARDPARAARATAGIAGIELDRLDLLDPASIADFTARFLATGRPLPILINSAGIMAVPFGRDPQGHELQFATNHLGHFRLTLALWPALERAARARVVSVSSRGHQIAGIDFDDPDFDRRAYDKWVAYGQSKTANALFARGLDVRGERDGIRGFSVHPGQILTELARHLSPEELAGFDALEEDGSPRIDPAHGMKTPAQGAATALWCATSAALDGTGGVYCEDCDVAPIHDPACGRKGVAPWAADSALAERLWTLSEAMTGTVLRR